MENKEPEKQQDWRMYKPSSSNLQKEDAANKRNTAKKNGGNGAAIAMAVLALILGAGGLAFGLIAFLKTNNNTSTVATVDASGYYTGNSVEFESQSIASIVSKVTPAVVSIITESYSSSSNYFYYYGNNQSVTQAAGTGMIVTSDGYILTNKHVVDGANKIEVITDDGETYDDVELVGTDPLNDIAYIKINNVSDLPTVTLGDSKTIAVGQPVLAIGNALGAYQNSVTQGIVSGTGRSIEASDSDGSNTETLTDMIQTDAAINPGNSGGPLVNAAGEVIGINSAVATDANGLGFAIPIAAARGMLENIKATGKAQRAYIGLTYVTITAEVAKEYNLSVSKGAYVYNSNSRSSAVVSGGPADKAGIKTGDIITKIGSTEVGAAGSISTLVGEYKVGDTINVTYIRDGEEHTTQVTLAAYSE